MLTIAALVSLTSTVWLIYVGVAAWRLRRQTLRRLVEAEEPASPTTIEPQHEAGWLVYWLSLAGFRRPGSPALFLAACVTAFVVSIGLAQAISRTVLPGMIQTVSDIPGGVGDALAVILQAGPLTIAIALTLSPILVVRASRRQRVRKVEQDLPLALELFATLAEAGLGFDAALARIVRSQRATRPLTVEFAAFQRDVLAGTPRLQALRQLARRVDVTSLTIFVSAITQAEQVGASVAETLRHQADDLRERRRERALLDAQALPVKLVFPLVGCFLPGIFLSTLGPVLYQMIQVANSVLRPIGR